MDVTPTIQHLHGRLRSITGTLPATGTEISETVPSRLHWILHSLRFGFTTDTNVADRRVTITLTDGTNFLLRLTLSNTQPANTSRSHTFAHFSTNESLANQKLFYPFPPLPLITDFVLSTSTTNIQAGDHYTAPQLLVEEWTDP